MCESIFRNQDKNKRKEDFTKLFAVLITNSHSQKEKNLQASIKRLSEG